MKDYTAVFTDDDGIATTFGVAECKSVRDARDEVRLLFGMPDSVKISVSSTKSHGTIQVRQKKTRQSSRRRLMT